MLFSWLYCQPVEPVWNSQCHKHIKLECTQKLPSTAVFYVYGTTSLGAAADYYEKQHSSTRNLYVLGVNSVQELRILH